MCYLDECPHKEHRITRTCVYLGLSCQHIVPEDGGPGTGQLTDIGDDDNRQRDGLQQQQPCKKTKLHRSYQKHDHEINIIIYKWAAKSCYQLAVISAVNLSSPCQLGTADLTPTASMATAHKQSFLRSACTETHPCLTSSLTLSPDWLRCSSDSKLSEWSSSVTIRGPCVHKETLNAPKKKKKKNLIKRVTPDQINHLICSISGNFLLLKLLWEER